jgi:hypothetical protein
MESCKAARGLFVPSKRPVQTKGFNIPPCRPASGSGRACLREVRNRSIIFGLVFSLTVPSVRAIELRSSNLPIMVIDTYGVRIENQRRIDAGLAVIDHGPGVRNRPDESPDGYQGRIRIEIRGSSAVWQGWPKQSYAFETVDGSGNPLDAPVLGMPDENDWILYGPYTDKTFLRDVLAYRIAADMGRYAPRTRFCELVLNGDYRGVYVLIEKIKRDKNRVAVAKMDPTDTAGDAVTGGYIIKVDRPAGEENSGWSSSLSPSPDAKNKVQYLYHYPRPSVIAPEQKIEIRRFMDAFETFMRGSDWGGRLDSFFDADAFIDYHLLNELTRNVDAYSLSTYMHKDRDSRGGRLKMGPVWDYNLGFGNADYYAGDSTAGWMIDRKVRLQDRIPFWVGTLWNDPAIRGRFGRRYRGLRDEILSTERVLALIDSWADTLAEAEARDHDVYPVLGTYVWPNPFVGETYSDEIAHLKEWIRKRLTWMDGATTDVMQRPEPPPAFELGMIYPNPFNSVATVPILLEHSLPVRLSVFDVRGRVCAKRDLGTFGPGIHRYRWYAGDLAAGVYTVQIECGMEVRRRTAVLIR